MAPGHDVSPSPATSTTRIATLQRWLNWAFPVTFFAATGIDVVASRLSIPRAYLISWFLGEAAWVLAGFAWGYIIYRYPQQIVGPARAAVQRTGMPRLYALATTWLYLWGAAWWVILGVSTRDETSNPMVPFLLVPLVALLPGITLEVVAWVRHLPERRRARADAAQDRAAWMMMNMRAATTEQTTGHERSRWRDRWRNRVRRAQRRMRR